MENITLRAHYDGKRILLDDKIDLPANTKLLITVIQSDVERESWLALSAQGLATAYADDEPEYSVKMIKEHNPDYETG